MASYPPSELDLLAVRDYVVVLVDPEGFEI
jgi:hypothetical protein